MDVTDKIAVVTGGGRGIGRGITLVLAGNGANVVVADINKDGANEVAQEVIDIGRESIGVKLDVTDQLSVDKAVEEILDRFGRIDILVNCAGIIASPDWEGRDRHNESDWDINYEVNVKGIARVTDAVSFGMKERKYGKIVNIASVSGRQGTLTNIPYGVTKAGVINLTQAQALELAPFNINVNSICPGLVWTDMWGRIAEQWGKSRPQWEGKSGREIYEETVLVRTPLGRDQTADDMGYAVSFLASDYAKNITGQSLNVSGGFFMN